MKKAQITCITGQDESYQTEFLQAKGYGVHGVIRCASSFNTGRIEHLFKASTSMACGSSCITTTWPIPRS